MLPKVNRLPHSKRITSRKSFSGSFFLVKYTPNSLEDPRFGIIISKKVDKRATIRNRIRRLLHQFIMDHRKDFSPSTDYLFIINKPFTEISPELLTDLNSILKQHPV